jgi:hypothetical protein
MVFAVGLVMVNLVLRRIREKRAKKRAAARLPLEAVRAASGAKRGTGQKGAMTDRGRPPDRERAT